MLDYNPLDYPPAAITTDLVVLTIRDDRLTVLLILRGEDPYRGRLALPGGFVRPHESLDAAARRELHEETGLSLDESRSPAGEREHAHLEQLKSYGDPGRDPRLRVVTVAYLALAPELPDPRAGGDAAAATWLPVRAAGPRLAFDHNTILADGVERARSKLEYTPLATAFCPPMFTVGQLRRVYEIVWDADLDPRNFHRKVTGTPGFLSPTGRATVGERGRPAQLYRRGRTTTLYPPMLRERLA